MSMHWQAGSDSGWRYSDHVLVVAGADPCVLCQMHRLTINTAGSSPHGYNPLEELGGFDFETESQTLETPTFSKSGSRETGGRETGGSFTRRCACECRGKTQ